jgi:GntR family transcriptional regulator
MSALDPNSRIPLYHQLADVLTAQIEAGEYSTGSRIPSEPELARRFGIGRPTVRQATDLLIRRQFLERRRGAGTFVVEPPEQIDLLSLAGTVASFEKKGISVHASVMLPKRAARVAADPENPFAGRDAYLFKRLSRVDQTPVLLEEIYLDPERFPRLEFLNLAGRSLSQAVAEHFGMRPTSADQNFRIIPLDSERASVLGLANNEPILLVKRHLHFPEARSAIFAELYCRTDQLIFSQTLVADPTTRGTHA